MPKMGFYFSEKLCRRKNRWEFSMANVIGDPQGNNTNISILPPLKTHRPNLSFKTVEAKHINEDIFYPAKPDWKTINITAYDIKTTNENPVFKKIKSLYDPSTGQWFSSTTGFITDAFVKMVDGLGNTLEQWIYENAWIESVDFGELDYGSSEVVVCDLTLRYARAYIENQNVIQN